MKKKKPKYYTIKHRQEVVSEYKYKNGAHIRILAVYPPLNGVDSLSLHLLPAKGKPLQFYFRPDEGLLLIRLIADAINRTTETYMFGLQKGKGLKY